MVSQREREELLLTHYIGIDAHRDSHTAVALDCFETKMGEITFNNDLTGNQKFISWLDRSFSSNHCLVGIEGGGSTRKALLNLLLQAGYPTFEVNPLFTKHRRGYGTKVDKSDYQDASLVASVLIKKAESLPQIDSHRLSSHCLVLNKNVDFWEETSRQSSRLKNQLHSLNKQAELAFDRREKQTIDYIIKEKKKQLKQISKTKLQLTARLNELLKEKGANLTTIKGVSTILAAKVIAHTQDISRFKNINQYISYTGIAPVEKSSGKNKRHVRNRRGNRKLNATFYLLALNQLRWNKQAKTYFNKKVSEGKSKKHALRCLMKRVAHIIYGMLKSGEDYHN